MYQPKVEESKRIFDLTQLIWQILAIEIDNFKTGHPVFYQSFLPLGKWAQLKKC